MNCPQPLMRPDEALRCVLQAAQAAAPRTVPLLHAVGRVLAEDIPADRDYPPFDRAMMDGYAVGFTGRETTPSSAVLGEIAAGQPSPLRLDPASCIEVMTGAACPEGTFAVVPQEQVVRDGGSATFLGPIDRGQYVAARGSDCRRGDVVLRSGDLITPLAVGVLATLGRRDVRVVPTPEIGILTTGGELIGSGGSPGPAQIRDSNGPMLAALAVACGQAPAHVLHAPDEVEAIVAALSAMRGCDLIVITGGVSMGRFDLVPESVRQLGAEVVFHKVSQKPGKPLMFARRDRQLLFGLPGNPLAVHLCFHRYVAAAIRGQRGRPQPAPQRLPGRLRQVVVPAGPRTWFVLGRAERAEQGAQEWSMLPLPGRSSADLFATSQANCYLEIPPGDCPLQAGALLPFEWLELPA